ncbi:MAG: UvrD/REP helicase [Idiomarina sp. T82-3]|uniref:3'-5' exonuclease n=1 Tax=Idiomarina TaxID=135575 RepID=UPI00079268AC|nr:3'-5' exonuclease [Idiomarina sp. T82-3]KXS33963.1 MAG: UvrD/REP helicase [Idiomarina sp. T82-3]
MLWGDIGVLVKTNGDAMELAKSLTEAGIPALCEQPGLLEEPEVALVRALMEIAYSNENRIAFAEVRSIINSEAVEAWLPELLNDDAKPSELLFRELTEALTALRDKKQQLSPTEMLTAVCANTPVLSTIRRWDDTSFNTQQRLANLDAFHRLLEEYEHENTSRGQPVTLEGLNRFLSQSAYRRNDIKGVPIGQAVSVMTIHKAKGLEWPCVILAFLDKNPKDRLFGVTVQSNGDAFTVDEPLRARQIKFLPPYTKGSAGNVFTSLKETQFGKQMAEKATEEEHRLLYVAFTRARNYLATLHDGKRGDKQVKSLLNECDYDFAEVCDSWPKADVECSESQLPFVEPGKQDLMPRYIQPSSVTLSEPFEAVNVSHYGATQSLSGTIDTAQLGNALHQLIAYIVLNRDEDISRVTKRLLLPHILDEQKLKPLMTQAQRFVETIDAEFNPSSAWVEMPVSALNDKSQTIKGSIDLLLETTNGLVVIDHKLRGAKTPEQQLGLIKDYGGQLNAYKKALEANGQPVNKVILHAFNSGSLIEVATV